MQSRYGQKEIITVYSVPAAEHGLLLLEYKGFLVLWKKITKNIKAGMIAF